MKNKVIMYSIVSIVTAIAIFFYSFRDTSHLDGTDDNEILTKYGTKYNPTRSASGIPLVETNWRALECDSVHIYWSHPGRDVDRTEPFHLYKTTFLNSDVLTSEKDALHYESKGDTAYRLVMISYMNGKNKPDSSRYDLIIYFKGKYPPSRSERITKLKSDSIIRQWKASGFN